MLLYMVWKTYQVRSFYLAGTEKLTKVTDMKKEMICETVGGAGCGLKRVLELIGGKWKILILCALNHYGTMRYGELRRAIAGITNTMLAQSLKELESDGLVRRTMYDERPVRVDYDLTVQSRELIPILLELQDWGRRHIQTDDHGEHGEA